MLHQRSVFTSFSNAKIKSRHPLLCSALGFRKHSAHVKSFAMQEQITLRNQTISHINAFSSRIWRHRDPSLLLPGSVNLHGFIYLLGLDRLSNHLYRKVCYLLFLILKNGVGKTHCDSLLGHRRIHFCWKRNHQHMQTFPRKPTTVTGLFRLICMAFLNLILHRKGHQPFSFLSIINPLHSAGPNTKLPQIRQKPWQLSKLSKFSLCPQLC